MVVAKTLSQLANRWIKRSSKKIKWPKLIPLKDEWKGKDLSRLNRKKLNAPVYVDSKGNPFN